MHDRGLAPGIYDKIFEMYAAAGMTPHIVPTSASPASAGGMIQVASGKGIYIGLGTLLSFGDTPGIVMVPLDEPGASLPVCMVWRASESSPVVLQFIESVRDLFQAAPRANRARAALGRSKRRERPVRRATA
jgi:DNA-binding transcriptional LysR family regulator